jgi:hypothetical protein
LVDLIENASVIEMQLLRLRPTSKLIDGQELNLGEPARELR